MPDSNESYFNSAVRHQVDVRRFTAGEVKAILLLLEKADRALVRKLRDRLGRLGQTTDFQSRRFQALLADVRGLREAAVDAVKKRLTNQLQGLAKSEVEAERRLLERAIPIEVSFATVPAETLKALVTTEPFQGKLLGDWFEDLAAADQRNLRQAIQLGMAQGEGIPEIVRRVAGTKANRFADGALAITRRNAEAVVRTAVNHVSNSARESMWEENSDIIQALRWTSTLDSRTTPICQSRDGALAPIGDKPLPDGAQALVPPGARPPAHIGCRSTLVAVIDGVGVVGNRPFVVIKDRPSERAADFAKEARRTGRPVQEVRDEWAREHIGQVPAKTTYNQWLRQQSAEFQDEVLGSTRGALFRRGNLDVQEFTDRAGNELTLDQLAERHPGAFREANVEM